MQTFADGFTRVCERAPADGGRRPGTVCLSAALKSRTSPEERNGRDWPKAAMIPSTDSSVASALWRRRLGYFASLETNVPGLVTQSRGRATFLVHNRGRGVKNKMITNKQPESGL